MNNFELARNLHRAAEDHMQRGCDPTTCNVSVFQLQLAVIELIKCGGALSPEEAAEVKTWKWPL